MINNYYLYKINWFHTILQYQSNLANKVNMCFSMHNTDSYRFHKKLFELQEYIEHIEDKNS